MPEKEMHFFLQLVLRGEFPYMCYNNAMLLIKLREGPGR